MIFNGTKCNANTSLGLVGWDASPPVSAPWSQIRGPRAHFVRSAMRLENFIQTTPKLYSLFTGVKVLGQRVNKLLLNERRVF